MHLSIHVLLLLGLEMTIITIVDDMVSLVNRWLSRACIYIGVMRVDLVSRTRLLGQDLLLTNVGRIVLLSYYSPVTVGMLRRLFLAVTPPAWVY